MIFKKYNYKITEIDGSEFVNEKYPVIIFNNVQLPLGAIFIDFCASSNFFKDIDEDLSKWFWRFTICVGKKCSDKSTIVIKYSKKLIFLIENNKDYVNEKINELYNNMEESTLIFQWWVDTLIIMQKTAKLKELSHWKGIPSLKT